MEGGVKASHPITGSECLDLSLFPLLTGMKQHKSISCDAGFIERSFHKALSAEADTDSQESILLEIRLDSTQLYRRQLRKGLATAHNITPFDVLPMHIKHAI